ncbi:MAG TPA: nucleosidase [Acidimicrobiales bacterium]|nr:nucleosidase [Acidimicrobiales bacterium]
MTRPLVAVALREEAAYLDSGAVDVVLTGPGKVSAALAVTEAIVRLAPAVVVNVGTAGALRPGLSGTLRVGTVIEHDFDHAGLTALLGVELPGPIQLTDESDLVLATGDSFVQGGPLRDALAERADLVDMEGYAVARACSAAGVSCEMWKVVSDEATEGALRSWQESIDASARRIAEIVRKLLR